MSYSRTNWQNLPNQTTPINATNLNKIEQGIYDATYVNGVNVGSSVDSDYKVNVLKSKNIFNSELEIGAFDSNGLNEAATTRIRSKSYIQVKPNTTYTASWSTTKNAKVQIIEYSKNDYTTAQIQRTPSGAFQSPPLNFTTSSTTKYIRVYINSTGDSSTSVSDISNIMLNSGSTALPYEPYVTPSINVDGETIVNKNVYSTSEVVIGEWFGKPLYRTTYVVTNKENSYGIARPSNVDTFTKLSVMQHDSDNAWIQSYYWTSSDYLRIFANASYIQIRTSKANNSFTHYIIAEYTKTTD